MLEGRIKTVIQGENGFGYDPMFFPIGSKLSMGEIDSHEKALLSHRGKAIEILKRKITGLSSE